MRRFSRYGVLTLIVWLGCAHGGYAQEMTALPGSVKNVEESQSPPAAGKGRKAFVARKLLSKAEEGATLQFEVALKMRDAAELRRRVARGEMIPPAEMAAKYLPTKENYRKVAKWLSGQGFEIVSRGDNRISVFARGSVSQIQSAMRTRFARVKNEDGEFSSAVTAPEVPTALAPLLVGVQGLQPHIRANKHLEMRPAGYGNPGTPPYGPHEILLAYDRAYSPNNVNGAGQTIAIIIDTFPAQSDLTAFWTANHINQSLDNISFIQVVPGDLPPPTGEETLDTQWASSIAPAAKVRVYATKDLQFGHVDQALQQIYSDVIAHPEYGLRQVSMSFGIGETYTTQSQVETTSQYIAQLASAGVSVFVSSGDGGSTPDQAGGTTGPVQAEYPATDPLVTAVGGTRLGINNVGTAVSSEEGWSRGGGGTSIYFDRPAWQAGPGLPVGTKRLLPDVAAAADPQLGALIYLNGTPHVIGGTSWSCPVWAGMGALLNQVRKDANMAPLGVLGTHLYPLLGSVNLRDITTGNNGFPVTAGYDLVTGAGVPHLRALAQTLGPSPITVLHEFGAGDVPQDGIDPKSSLIHASDGFFYGTTQNGGSAGKGTVFRATAQGVVTILHHFGDGSVPRDGASPMAITQGVDGNFYGVTSSGGTISIYGDYSGTIFRMTPQGTVTILRDFGDGSVTRDASHPSTPLTLGTDGNFYGTTAWGGASVGAAYKITSQGAYTLLHRFSETIDNGSHPSALVQGPDGNFYGTTSQGGGVNGHGLVFRMTPQGAVTIVHRFADGSVPGDGRNPVTPLTLGNDGNFYGTTTSNIFKMTPQGVITILHRFGNSGVLNDGSGPAAGLLLGRDGHFYGTTMSGGNSGRGVIFKMSPTGAMAILHSIGDGSTTTFDLLRDKFLTSLSTPIQAPDGTLYGTSSNSTTGGIIYKMTQANTIQFTSPAHAVFTAEYPGSFQVAASGSPSPTLQAANLPAWASFDHVTGTLSGTPPGTAGSPFVITVTAHNGTLPEASQTLILTVQPPTAPVFASEPLAATYRSGVAHSFQFQATGFPAPTFAVLSGNFPSGLTLDAAGYLSGIPTAGGLYTGIIRARNGIGMEATQNFSIGVEEVPRFINAPLNAVLTIGSPFHFTYEASGYPPPVFSTYAPLPQGLTLTAGGVLSGTPTGPYGIRTGTILATNPVGGTFGTSDSQSFTLTVQMAPVMNPIPPTTAVLAASYYYSFAPNVAGYPAPTYSLTSGTLPPGVTLSADGILFGTPNMSGTFSGVVTASNGVNPAAMRNFVITVQTANAPAFINAAPPAGTINVPYRFAVQASGAPAVRYVLESGALPPGLSMEIVSPFSFPIWTGRIIGTPTTAGTYTFTTRATNGINPQASQSYTIRIYPTALEWWPAQYFTPSQMADHTVSGLHATPQGDGISNLLKYLYNIDPGRPMSAADRAALPVAGATLIDEVPYVTLTYRRNAAMAAMAVAVESSNDLQSWATPSNAVFVQSGTDAITGDPIIQARVPAEGTNQFLRLRVTPP